MEDKKEEYMVVKHNSLINARSDLIYTSNQLKLICHLIAHIKPTDTNFETKEVSLRELGFVGKDSYNYTRFKEEFLQLLTMPFQLPGTKGWTNWFSYLEYTDGSIKYAFDERLKSFLLNLKDNFTSYQLKNVLLLQSAYNIKLYELLAQYKIIGHRKISLENLRYCLNIPISYQNKDIIRLIENLQLELSEKTDINFSFEIIKNGKKFEAINFIIKVNKIKKENKLSNLDIKDKLKKLRLNEI